MSPSRHRRGRSPCLPAAERLLFNPTYAGSIIGAVDGDFLCHLLAAVAGNLADIAAALVSE